MFLGRNSFPETELIQLQLLNFLGAFSLIFENEFCALQGAESEKYNFFLQSYKTGSIMLGWIALGWTVHCCWALAWSPFKSKHSFIAKHILQGFLVGLNMSCLSEFVNGCYGKKEEGNWGDKSANFSKHF